MDRNKKSKVRAKNISKVGIILAIIISIGFNLYKLIATGSIATMDEQKSILLLSGSIMIFCSPIILSIWIDKFLKRDE